MSLLGGSRVRDGGARDPAYDRTRLALHERLAQEFRPDGLDPQRREDEARMCLLRWYEEQRPPLTLFQRDQLIREILQDALFFGPLTPLLRNEAITEIMVNGPAQVYVEQDGAVALSAVRFRDDAHVRLVVDRILGPLGRRIDESAPMVDARIPDGSRLHAVIPPVSRQGTLVTIRKFRSAGLGVEDLVRYKSLTPVMADLLRSCVVARCAMLVSGGTSVGKTSLLNVLSRWIDPAERVVTIEDTAELRLPLPHWLALEARPANLEGKGEITQRDLVRASLRMRPDRILVGESRGAEAWELVKALNTGHEGGMSTIHANSAREALPKLAQYTLEAGLGLPYPALMQSITSAFQVVIHMARDSGGRRYVASITEILGAQEGEILTHDLVVYQPDAGMRVAAPERLHRMLGERGGQIPPALLEAEAEGVA